MFIDGQKMSVDYTHLRRALSLDESARPDPKSPFFAKLAKADTNQKAYRALMQASMYEFSILQAVARALLGSDVRTYHVVIPDNVKEEMSEEMREDVEEVAQVGSLEKLVSAIGSMINENDEDYDNFHEALSLIANLADTVPIKHN